MTAGFPLNNFNQGGRRLICMRALPGDVSITPIHSPAGPIGINEPDSYFRIRTYVIRRSDQTLPCIVVHFVM
jgi:hypothetical protein